MGGNPKHHCTTCGEPLADPDHAVRIRGSLLHPECALYHRRPPRGRPRTAPDGGARRPKAA